jgi:hypothetical protein
MTKLNGDKVQYFLDGEDRPCLRIPTDSFQQDWPLRHPRARAYLRNLYRYLSDEKDHLGNAELGVLLDYLSEEAYKGGRRDTSAVVKKEGDYNFEAVLVFANTWKKPEMGTKQAAKEGSPTSEPKLTYDEKSKTLTYEAMTADLWRAINDYAIEQQVRADKATLFRAINFFSRRLSELKDAFSRRGLDVTISHKADGSWVAIGRRDETFCPEPVVLADGRQSSASATPSAGKSNNGTNLDDHDGTRIAIEADTPKSGRKDNGK